MMFSMRARNVRPAVVAVALALAFAAAGPVIAASAGPSDNASTAEVAPANGQSVDDAVIVPETTNMSPQKGAAPPNEAPSGSTAGM